MSPLGLPQSYRAVSFRSRSSMFATVRGSDRFNNSALDIFLRSILRSGEIRLQKCAILCNALQTTFVRLTHDSQCCATQRKPAQFVSLELEIRCSFHLTYRRKIGERKGFLLTLGTRKMSKKCPSSAPVLSLKSSLYMEPAVGFEPTTC